MNKAYTVAIGNFSIPFTKDQKKIVEEIKKMDGFVGLHFSSYGTLLLFETENNAKVGRNILRSMNVQTGINITEVEYNPKEAINGKEQ